MTKTVLSHFLKCLFSTFLSLTLILQTVAVHAVTFSEDKNDDAFLNIPFTYKKWTGTYSEALRPKIQTALEHLGYLIWFTPQADSAFALGFTDSGGTMKGQLIFGADAVEKNLTGKWHTLTDQSHLWVANKEPITVVLVGSDEDQRIELIKNIEAIADEFSKTAKIEFSFISKANAAECDIDKWQGFVKDFQSNSNTSVFLTMINGCLSGPIDSVKATAGRLVDLGNLLFSFVQGPQKFIKAMNEQLYKLIDTVMNLQRSIDGLKGIPKLPPETKAELICSLLGDIGTGSLMAFFTAGASAPAFAKSVAQFLEKVSHLGPTLSWIARLNRMGVSAKITPRLLKVLEKVEIGKIYQGAPAVFKKENLDRHFKKHYKEFGLGNSPEGTAEYQRRALAFSRANNPEMLSFYSPQRNVFFKYNSKTNELIVINKTGNIESYFKPSLDKHNYPSNLEYFLEEYYKW